MADIKPQIRSWAVPTEDDNRAWEAMTRDEQIETLRRQLNSVEANTPSTETVDSILDRVLSRNNTTS